MKKTCLVIKINFENRKLCELTLFSKLTLILIIAAPAQCTTGGVPGLDLLLPVVEGSQSACRLTKFATSLYSVGTSSKKLQSMATCSETTRLKFCAYSSINFRWVFKRYTIESGSYKFSLGTRLRTDSSDRHRPGGGRGCS